MSPETIARLSDINRRFYEARGAEFSRARRSPWPGWQRVFDRLFDRAETTELAILDAGCGNGRLAIALEARLGAQDLLARYVGIDESPVMIAEAELGLGALAHTKVELRVADLFSAELEG